MEVLVQRSPKFSSYLRSRRGELRLSMSTCAAEVAGSARCVRWWRSATRPWRLGAGAGRLWGRGAAVAICSTTWEALGPTARLELAWSRGAAAGAPWPGGLEQEQGRWGSRTRGGVLAREELAWNRGKAGARLEQGSSRRGFGAGAQGRCRGAGDQESLCRTPATTSSCRGVGAGAQGRCRTPASRSSCRGAGRRSQSLIAAKVS